MAENWKVCARAPTRFSSSFSLTASISQLIAQHVIRVAYTSKRHDNECVIFLWLRDIPARRRHASYVNTESKYIASNCKLIKVFHLSREGTRPLHSELRALLLFLFVIYFRKATHTHTHALARRRHFQSNIVPHMRRIYGKVMSHMSLSASDNIKMLQRKPPHKSAQTSKTFQIIGI